MPSERSETTAGGAPLPGASSQAASERGVGAQTSAASGRGRPARSSRIAISCAAASESPPSPKKLSSGPTAPGSSSSSSAQSAAISRSRPLSAPAGFRHRRRRDQPERLGHPRPLHLAGRPARDLLDDPDDARHLEGASRAATASWSSRSDVFTPGRRTIAAATSSPTRPSGTANAHASADAPGAPSSASSTSPGEHLSPPRLIIAFSRLIRKREPFVERLWSPSGTSRRRRPPRSPPDFSWRTA